MKKINFNQLFMSWNEKQKPRRIGRYAAILIMLLTLGVGQMWGTKKVWIDVTSAPSGYTSNMIVQYYVGSSWTSVWAQSYGSVGSKTIYYADIADGATKWQVYRGDDLKLTNTYNWQWEMTYSGANMYKVTGWNNSGDGSKVIGMVTGGYMYYDDHLSDWSGTANKYFVIGHDSYYGNHLMTNAITNTKLWYFDNNSETWADAKYFAFFAHTGDYPSASKAWSDIDTYATHKTAQYTSDYNLVNNGHYLCVPSASGERKSFTISSKSAYTDLNHRITIKEKYNSSGSTPWAEVNAGTTHGTISAAGYKFGSWTACNTESSATVTKETTTYSAYADFGYTNTVRLTAGATKAGKAFVGWYDNSGTRLTTSTTYDLVVTGATTVWAYYKDEETHDITVSYVNNNSQTIKNSTTESAVGVSTTRSVTAPAINDHTWASWTVGTGVKNNSANTTTNPISINSKASGSYTLQANYNLIPCSIVYKFGSGNEVFNRDGTGVTTASMSYDVTSNAYYKDVTVSGTQLNFRFYYNTSKEYATAWNGSYPGVYSVTINGDPRDCNTEVQGWENKSSIKVTYASGTTSLRVWYSKQTGKAWVTETTYSVSVASENTNRGTVNKSSVTAGRNTASASFQATPVTNSGWMFKQWSATSPASLVSSATTNPNTVKATSTGGSVQAQFKHRYILRGSTNASDSELGGMAGWGATDNSSYASATISDGVMTITANLTKAKTKYKFKIYDLSADSHKGQTGSSDIPDNTSWTLNGSNNVTLTTTAAGTYTFVYTVSSNSLKVLFPSPVYSVTYGVQSGTGTVTAKIGTESIGASPGKAVGGANVVMTASDGTGYQFQKWVNESGTQISTSNPYTISSIAANCTIKAVFTARNYTAANNLKEADGTANGQYNVTYDNTSIAHTSAPSRTGYTIEGYYKQAAWTNKIANTNLSLVASTDYATSASKWKVTSAPDLYIKWQQSLTLAGNGAGSTNGSVTTTYLGTASSHTAATRTGYTLNGYYDNTSGGNKILTNTGALVTYSASVSDYINSSGKWIYNGTPTLSAQWTANKYDVTLKANTGTGDDQLVQATYDAAMPTTLKVGGGAVTVHTKTGYTLLGYWDDASSGNQYYNYNAGTSTLSSYRTWNKTAATNLYAHWQANQYTVTLDVDEDNKGNIEGATTSQSVTYDATPSTIANRPTAANGYALVGYYTDQNGEGLKVINGDGTWIASVTGYTDGSGNWKRDGDATLYAYYKKAEITNLVLSPTAVPNDGTTITATPTISPAPEGTTKICWELQYSNGTAHASQPVFTPGSGNAVTFPAPTASGTYRVQATLRTGSSCEGGDVLDTRYSTFQVAGEHEVTVRYQDADGRTIKASTTITAQPLNWTDNFSAPDIPGYTFTKWVQGEGVTIDGADGNGEKTTNPIRIKATYAGTLTAVYAKKDIIYFNNTVGWNHVYVYFYSSDKYWSDTYGTGAQYDKVFPTDKDATHKPHWRHFWGEMTQIEGTNVYYFDYQAAAATIDPSNASEINGYTNVAFTEAPQGYGYGTDGKGYEWFHNTKAARRGDFDHDLPMFVPLTTKEYTKNGTDYYNHGYWMNYPENTGYTLKIYSSSSADKASGATSSIAFPFSADKAMPLKLDVEFNTSGDRWFMIYRNDGNYYSKNYTIKQGYNAEQLITVVNDKLKLVPSAKGIYTFTLTYHDDNFYIDVDYPIATNDYRIYYTDNAAWSGGTHGAGWYHPSDVINKIGGSATEAKKDIVSLYIAKDSSPSMKFQKASVTNEGVITWSDVASGTINLSSFSSDITKAGVYNIYVSQPVGGSIQVDSIKPYKGNYYIRTDCAGSSKWDSYKALDHHMTYSEYTKDNWGYTHYYCHWVTGGTNVKFTIANDYSVSISDSLIADYGTVVANIDGSGFLASGSANNANIRFMWNESTNKLSRAYIRGSGSITDRFLVLEGDAKMFDEAGNALTGDYQDHDKWGNKLGTDNQVIMHDDKNFVYERTIKVQTTARARLSADYNSHTQYFIGSSGAFADGTTVELLGGSASATKYDMRIVYDFKTNRLVTAYVPSDTVKSSLAINADLMLVREHQEDGKQLVFKGVGAGLSNVHTVYGVMRFNRWTLNNKSTADGHAPLGDPKSGYERGLYWISFPFDVNLSDVFGFGTYGVDWIIMEYDGATRAEKGYWIDSDSFWKYITSRAGKTLEAGKGYVLALDLDRMKSDNTEFWANNIEQVELFFPSATNTIGSISATNVTMTVDSHECTINRHTQAEQDAHTDTDINKNRTKADSHWNIIGVPSYANYGTTLTSDGSTTITWNSTPSATNSLPFLYEWNMMDNTYTVQSGTTYPFKAMHAYMVQYAGELHWSLASATPTSPIVARRTYAEEPQNVEFRLELQQNDKMIDQTFVKLSNDEKTSGNFIFDEDLCKEYNGTKANIYTFIEGYIPAAGNTLPMSEQTTVIPVGVQIKTDGEYTFAMPAGTDGVGVTLIDNVTNTRTNLGLTDYTVTLSSGTIDGRFVLEISPIAETPTDVELINGENGANGVRKVIIDQKMYIIKGDRIYDATGALVK